MIQTPALAGRLERFMAAIADMFAVMIFPSLLLTAFQANVDSPLSLVSSFVCSGAYYIWFTLSDWQATPGQRLFNLRVVRLNGLPMDWRASTERFLAFYLPQLPFYTHRLPEETLVKLVLWLVIVWFSPILWRADRRGVHDIMCGTLVVTGKR